MCGPSSGRCRRFALATVLTFVAGCLVVGHPTLGIAQKPAPDKKAKTKASAEQPKKKKSNKSPTTADDDPYFAGREVGMTARDFAPPDAMLTGLDAVVKLASVTDAPHGYIAALRPLYGDEVGAFTRGPLSNRDDTGDFTRLEARPGYAVGAFKLQFGKRLFGFRLVYMKRDGDRLDPSQVYESRWIGGRTDGPEIVVSGEGRPLLGLVARVEQGINGVGIAVTRDDPSIAATQGPRRSTEELIAVVERIGGRVVRDDSIEGRPIVAVDFSETSTLNDEVLAALAEIETLKTLELRDAQCRAVVDGWSSLARMTSLEAFLAPRNWSITDHVLTQLGKLPRLRTIDLSGVKVTDTGVAGLGGAVGLEELRLSGEGITDRSLPALRRLKNLKLLMLSGTGITDDGLSVVDDLPSLIDLQLYSVLLSDAGAAHLSNLDGLEGLVLSSNAFSSEALKRLSALKNLRRLRLGGRGFNDAAMTTVGEFTQLRELTLYFTSVTDEGFAALGGLEHLESLHLIRTPSFVGSGLKHLPAPSKLRILQAVEGEFNDDGLEEVSRFVNLTSLDVAKSHVTSYGLRVLKSPENLASLTLSGTGITDDALRAVAAMKKLTTLALDDTLVSSYGVGMLTPLQKLQTIWLTNTTIDDEGAAVLATLPELKTIGLADTRVGDMGMESLAKLPNLEVMNVRNTRVTDRSARLFLAMPRLQQLNLTGTSITDATIETLTTSTTLERLWIERTTVGNACLPFLVAMPAIQHVYMRGTKIDYVKSRKLLESMSKGEFHSISIGGFDQRFQK